MTFKPVTRGYRSRLCLLSILLLAMAPSIAMGELANDSDMEQVCTNWLAYSVDQQASWGGVTNPTIAGVQDITAGDTLLGRVYNIDPGGYVVVPTLKALPPIKMYSDVSHLDMTAEEGPAPMIREVLHHRMTIYAEYYGSLEASQPATGEVLFDRKNHEQWDKFAVSTKDFIVTLNQASATGRSGTGPLLTSVWDQGDPFNRLCPIGSSGRCPVGCVATAAAQIMAFWQWPPQGTGSHSYWWDGDGTGGRTLSADFSDPYDWENIPDDCRWGCEEAEETALAELNYEVGVAFNMHYASDGSGAYTMDAANVFPNYFKYKTSTEVHHRNGNTAYEWFELIKAEVNAGRPMEYRITGHAIVCDGWRDDGGINQYHFNYGWSDSHNAWYTLDNLHCPWDGCNFMAESMVTHIEPNMGALFNSDIQIGWVPFDVQFDGESEWEVDQWIWDFGDGDSAFTDTTIHTYTESGMYDVRMEVLVGSDSYYCNKQNYIVGLADSLYADSVPAIGPMIEITIYGVNNIPLDDIIIPVEFSGDVDMDPYTTTWTTEDCRSAHLDYQQQVQFNPATRQMAFRLSNNGNSGPLPAGSGPLIKIQFQLGSIPATGAQTTISLDGYGSYEPLFTGDLASYQPRVFNGLVGEGSCCRGRRGNIDDDPGDSIDIVDLIYLVNYMFQDGPELPCPEEANVNGDIYGEIDITDLIHLVTYMFQGGVDPAICY
jgi:PKD repeat protein